MYPIIPTPCNVDLSQANLSRAGSNMVASLYQPVDNLIDLIYLEWVNDFISVQGYADHYGMTYEQATQVIKFAREYKV
jgi:hypothetical protein